MNDEVIEIDEDGNVGKPVKGPIRDSGMTDAERAVREVGLAINGLKNEPTAANHADLWRKFDHAIEAVRREDQRAICNCHDLAADPHAPTQKPHDNIKECARSIAAEEREMENEACAKVMDVDDTTFGWEFDSAVAVAAIRARIGKEGE